MDDHDLLITLKVQVDRLVSHIESERRQLNHVRQELTKRIDSLEATLQTILTNTLKKNGKMSLREISAWTTAIATGIAAVIQYLR